jgi:hypothetical protein
MNRAFLSTHFSQTAMRWMIDPFVPNCLVANSGPDPKETARDISIMLDLRAIVKEIWPA